MSTRNLEFGVINSAYVGRKNKYVYAAIGDPMPRISGVVKLDVSNAEHKECIVASRMFGPGTGVLRGQAVFRGQRTR